MAESVILGHSNSAKLLLVYHLLKESYEASKLKIKVQQSESPVVEIMVVNKPGSLRTAP